MSKENLSQTEYVALKKLLQRVGCNDIQLPEPPKEKSTKFCPECGHKTHPDLQCWEVKDFYQHTDEAYFRLIDLILANGQVKKNRTGIDTIGVFGAQAKFKVDLDAFPILTTKKVWFKGIVHELLWFIRGDTNIKYLVDNDVHIWDEWAYKRYVQYWEKNGCSITHEGKKIGKDIGARSYAPYTQPEFIQRIKEDKHFAQQFGDLGEGTYGGMWRDFPHFKQTYKGPPERCGVGDEYEPDGVDQLRKVIDKLKSNPDDRRMIVSAWHPYWVDHCALPPCHCLFHFNTEELTLEERKDIGVRREGMNYKAMNDAEVELFLNLANIPTRKLNCLLYQRSCDTFLGVPFNITSYALLTAMIAHVVGMEPGVFTHTYGDLHIYTNHLDQVKEQKTRTHKKLPELWLSPKVKDLFDFKFEDIKLIGYDPHPAIKGEVAV